MAKPRQVFLAIEANTKPDAATQKEMPGGRTSLSATQKLWEVSQVWENSQNCGLFNSNHQTEVFLSTNRGFVQAKGFGQQTAVFHCSIQLTIGGFPARHGLPPIAGWFMSWKIPWKWMMIWGYPHFRKCPIHLLTYLEGRSPLRLSSDWTVHECRRNLGMHSVECWSFLVAMGLSCARWGDRMLIFLPI